MNDEVNDSKTKIDSSMTGLTLLITKCQQWNASFNDPEYQQAPDKESHSLHRMFLQLIKVLNNITPHGTKSTEKLRRNYGKVNSQLQVS